MEDFFWNQGLHELHEMGIEIYPYKDIKEGVLYYEGGNINEKARETMEKMLKVSGIDKELTLKKVTDEVKQRDKDMSEKMISGDFE